jgi:hypothetical protein
MNVSKAFEDFPDEGLLVGKILVAYTNLEIDLMNCIKTVLSDLDTVLKVMYRVRGETQRIEVAVAIGYQAYKDLNLEDDFKYAILCLRTCVRIRNQYAHSIFWNDNSGILVFSDLEKIAKSDEKITNIHGIQKKYINEYLLNQQLIFFEYTSDFLMFLLNEGLSKRGKRSLSISRPTNAKQPELFLTH